MFGKFIQVRVCFVLPVNVSGELELVREAGPVFQHSRFVGRDDDSESGVQADLGERRGVHLVEDVERRVAASAVVDEDLPRGFLRAGHGGDGIARVVDPLRLARVEATKIMLH